MPADRVCACLRAVRPGCEAAYAPAGEPADFHIPGALLKDEPGTLIWLTQPVEGPECLVKMYRHRGALTTLREQATRFRVQREYENLEHLRRADIPCTEPVCWATGRDKVHGFYEILVTEYISGAQPIRAVYRRVDDLTEGPDLTTVFEQIRAMHRAGLYHGALNARNVMLRPGVDGRSAEFFQLDLPNAVCFPYDLAETRMAWHDLMHFSKRISVHVQDRDALRILEAYAFSKAKRTRFVEEWQTYRASRHTRNRLRAAFRFRAWRDNRTAEARPQMYPGT